MALKKESFIIKLRGLSFSLRIARRYLFSKKSHNAINIISGISALGVAIGTMALVVVLSVFNGFEGLITDMFSSFDPELRITLAEGKSFDTTQPEIKQLRQQKSIAVLLYNNTDKRRLHKMVTDSFPPLEVIRAVYDAISNYLMIATGGGKGRIFSFMIEDFSKRFEFPINSVYHSLKLLERQGYISYIENVDNYSRIFFTVRRDDLYRIQLDNAGLDVFIKLILRSYTGVFTDFVNIDEALLARRSNLTGEHIYQQLKLLAQLNIIDYIPQKKTPVIVYETERLAPCRIRLSTDNYQQRKVKYQQQVDSVINYASNDRQCRSVVLLEYFGQYGSEPCGFCDVCTGDHESGMRLADFNRISDKISKVLIAESYSIDKLVKQINESEPAILKVSRWLLDNGILRSGSNGLLTHNSKGQ